MGTNVGSDFLFVRPSARSGAARILDIFGTFDEYNSSRTPAEADAKAMFLDWFVTGRDLKSAIQTFEAPPDQGELFEETKGATRG